MKLATILVISIGIIFTPAYAAENFSTLFPSSQQMIEIEQGTEVRLDVCDVSVSRIMIRGRFIIDDALGDNCKQIMVSANSIMVMGPSASLEVGSETDLFDGNLTITLNGSTEDTALINGVHDRFLMVMAGAKLDFHGASAEKVSWTQLDGNARKGVTFVRLARSVNWVEGDEVVIAPTGMEAREAEVRTIDYVSSDGYTIFFDTPLAYEHFGKKLSYGDKTIDMRAEVGLLSRNIVIQGDDQSDVNNIGGHIMIMNNEINRPDPSSIDRSERSALFDRGVHPDLPRPAYQHISEARFEGVELRRMGQMRRQGRYTIHYHLIDDGSASYVRNTSMRDGFQRGVNIHGTNNLRVQNNVGYNIFGHMYAWAEEGDEMFNIVEGNLGVLNIALTEDQRAFTGKEGGGRFEQEGPRAAVFWGRNPFNTIHNNRAAGSLRGNGFFIDSTKVGHELSRLQAANTGGEVCDFDGNAAHSTFRVLGSPDLYGPRVKGFGVFAEKLRNSRRHPPVQCTIKNTEVYKAQFGGVWAEDNNTVEGGIITDSHIGVAAGEITNSIVIVGQTENTTGDEHPYITHRGDPSIRDMSHPQRGRGGVHFRGSLQDQSVSNVTCINLPSCLVLDNTSKDNHVLTVSGIEGADLDQTIYVSTKLRKGRRLVRGMINDLDGSLTNEGGQYDAIDPIFITPTAEGPIQFGWEWNDYE